MNANLDKNSLKLLINEEKILPMAFRSFWPQENTIKNFCSKDFKLFSIFPTGIKNTLDEPYSMFGEVWIGEGKYNFENLDKQIDMFLKNAPDSYFSLMVHLDTRDWFLEKYPDCPNSFDNLIQMVSYDKWIEESSRFMLDMIDYIDKKYPEKMYGVFIFAGYTCEWFTGYETKNLIYNKLHSESFKKYANAEIPTSEQLINTQNGEFRHPINQINALKYWKFHNEEVTKTICHFSKIIKEHTNNSKLVGLFYGYLNGLGNGVISRGHNDLRTILNCPDIDLLFAPANYSLRAKSSTSGAFIPLESLKLHNKLYFHEIDNTTHLVKDVIYGQRLNDGGHRKMDNLYETTMYFRRENAVALSHNQGSWWFDMFSGWYDDDKVMNEIALIKSVNEYMADKDLSSIAEIAVFTDQTSNYYLNIERTLGYDLVSAQIEQLNKIGVPYDNYLSDDICSDNFCDDKYKLYIFLNLFAPSDEIRNKVSFLRKQGKNFLFLYASGYITNDGFSLEQMSELTGMTFQYSGLNTVGKIVCDDNIKFGFTQKVTPSFTTNSGEVLGVYENTDIAAFAIKNEQNSFTAWSGVGAVPYQMLKKLVTKAKIFIYSQSGDPIYMNKSLFGLYAHKKGIRKINMPNFVTMKSLYTDEIYKGTAIEINYNEDEMKLFEIIGENKC